MSQEQAQAGGDLRASMSDQGKAQVNVPLKTLRHLEWGAVLEALAERCRGPVAEERALSLELTCDERTLRLELQRVDEARALLDEGHSPPLGQPVDVSDLVKRAQRGGVLDVDALSHIGASLEAAHKTRRFFKPLSERYPALDDLAVGLADLQSISREISASVTPQGELSDLASGELGELRRKVETLDVQLKERVSTLTHDELFEGMLQDDFYTLRDDRYVLPVKSGHKRHVDGIVHGWSSSGATVYIEPQVVVEANNRLLMAQADVKREVHRVLSRLSKRVAERGREVIESAEALAELDFVFAKAALSKDLNASSPHLSHEPTLSLQEARHPLLALSPHVEVVPNNIELGAMNPQAQSGAVLVVTGPNAGGKTVVMKTAGVIVMMALAGLHVPTAPGALIPLVPALFSDMGDEQNLGEGHSTFSGHMANLSSVLRLLKPGSLVLLDELAIGTDPSQGAALAQAILEHLASQGALVFVTTHYEELKLLPRSDERFRNGAVEYDEEAQAPTYRLQYDALGASSALQIARRCGLPEALLERAQALSGEQRARLDEVIKELEAEATSARAAKDKALAELKRHRDLNNTLEVKERKLADQLARAVDQERSVAIKEARKVRDQARALREQLKEKGQDVRSLEEQERELTRLADELDSASVEEQLARYPQDLDLSSLSVGQRVWVITLGTHAKIASLPNAKGQCEVSEGILRIQVRAEALRMPRERLSKDPRGAQPSSQEGGRGSGKGKSTGKKGKKGNTPSKKTPLSWEELPPQSPDLTCDVRGQRVEDAFEAITAALDRLTQRDAKIGFIIHGHGTGALKRAVRAWLKTCPYVDAQRPGQPHEGGDGVTAVRLR